MVELKDQALNPQNGDQVLRSFQEWMVQQAHAAKSTNQAAQSSIWIIARPRKDLVSFRVLRPENLPSNLQAVPRQNSRLT